MADLAVTHAVILSTRDDVRDALRQEVKGAGIDAAFTLMARTAKDFWGHFRDLPGPIVILDWEAGPEQVFEVLKMTRGASKVETVPILLLAALEDDGILAVAAEHMISRVHIGPISRSDVRTKVRELVAETKNLSPIRQFMIKVEKLIQDKEFGTAKTLLLQMKEKSPYNSRVVIELASVCVELDQWDEAAKILLQLTNVDPPLPRAKHLMARILMRQGDTEGALHELRDAQLVSPYNVDRLMDIGQILLENGSPQGAKDAFEDILGFAPEAKVAKLGKGQSLLQMGEINEALMILKEASSSRELASVFNTAAILTVRRGEHEKAISLYRSGVRALVKSPRLTARLMYNMGIGYVKARNAAKGLECFQKAVALDAGYAAAQHNVKALLEKRMRPAKSGGPDASDLTGLDEQLTASGGLSLNLGLNTDFDEHFGTDDDTLE